MRFAFCTRNFTRVAGTSFRVETLFRSGDTVEAAFACLPEGTSVFCWYEVDEACTMCQGPFHPATGHWESHSRHWCGTCTRSMVQLLKECQNRRWGGVRFYDHARVPEGDTSARDLSQEE